MPAKVFRFNHEFVIDLREGKIPFGWSFDLNQDNTYSGWSAPGCDGAIVLAVVKPAFPEFGTLVSSGVDDEGEWRSYEYLGVTWVEHA